MKITKYDHACLVVEEQGKNLVIDPGGYSSSLPSDLNNVVAVVITHVHQDHLDEDKVKEILTNNPGLQIFSTQEVADQLEDDKVNVMSDKTNATVGPFSLEFFGGQHAQVHSSIPINQNIGVLVNKTLYYPGDSFTTPKVPVKVLAVPVNAPWLKLAESMDFLIAVKPEIAFPTHNVFLSDEGASLANHLVSTVQGFGGQYKFLKPGQSLEF